MNKSRFLVLFFLLNIVFLILNFVIHKNYTDLKPMNTNPSLASNTADLMYRQKYYNESKVLPSGVDVFDNEELNIRIKTRDFYNPRVEVKDNFGEYGLYSSIDVYDGDVLKERINLHDSSKISWDEVEYGFFMNFFGLDDRSNTLYSIPELPGETTNKIYPMGLEDGVSFFALNLDKIYDPYLYDGELSYRRFLNDEELPYYKVETDCFQYRRDNPYRYFKADLFDDLVDAFGSSDYVLYGYDDYEIYTLDYLEELEVKISLGDFINVHTLCNLGGGKDLVITSNASGDREMNLFGASGKNVLASQSVFDDSSSVDINLYGGSLFDDGGKVSCYIDELKSDSFLWVCPYPIFTSGITEGDFGVEYEYYEIGFDGEIIDQYIYKGDEF